MFQNVPARKFKIRFVAHIIFLLDITDLDVIRGTYRLALILKTLKVWAWSLVITRGGDSTLDSDTSFSLLDCLSLEIGVSYQSVRNGSSLFYIGH